MDNVLPLLADQLLATKPPSLVDDVPGLTSPRVQVLLNRCVGALPRDQAYLEIGCWHGASLIAALLGNPDATAVACDNFSQFTQGDPRARMRENLQRYADRIPALTFYDGDCFELPRQSLIRKPVGVYFYDGDHTAESHVRAFTEFQALLAAEVIVLVDDWNFDAVRQGTWRGIDAIRPKQVWFRELPSRGNCDRENFWNGIGAFHLVRRDGPST
jgi:hypothetical protein